MTAQIPVVSTSYTPSTPGGPGVTPVQSYQYKDVGTKLNRRQPSTELPSRVVRPTADTPANGVDAGCLSH